MATIDTAALLVDTKFYLPAENKLDDTALGKINTDVIANRIPEDDDIYYSQALCLSLQQAGQVNLSLSTVKSSGRKLEKTGMVTKEWYKESKNPWTDYLKNLKNLCPILPGGGYTGLSSGIGIQINPSDPIDVNDTSDCTGTEDTDTHL